MTPRLIAPLVLVLALSACAPAPAPSGAGAPVTPPTSPAPTATPTAAVDVPIVDGSLTSVRASVPPVRVQVPAIGADMEVVPVGVEPNGAMELPVDPAVAGWYRFGPDPWSPDGNTVIAAHIDAPYYPIGPFAGLRDLPAGAEVTVTGADGASAVYAVSTVTYYPKQELPTQDLFARQGTRALVLITCGGEFDETTGHYDDNVVVVATPVA